MTLGGWREVGARFVTLNLFQGPFGRTLRVVPGVRPWLVRAARWMLKRVQHDEGGWREVGSEIVTQGLVQGPVGRALRAVPGVRPWLVRRDGC